MNTKSRVANHYGGIGLLERIESAFAASGVGMDELTVDALAPVDAFHVRGRAATVEIAEMAKLSSSELVLDVGCGLGGTARYLADQFGCRVTGVDLTAEFVEVGQQLTERVGLGDQVELRCADATELPFADNHFDVVWTEHVQMNVEDKARFYGEISRVLKPGGRFLFHDLFRGPGEALLYPVPWADRSEISFLATPDEAKGFLADVSLELEEWHDKTDESVAFFKAMIGSAKASERQPLGIQLVMGDSASEKIQNLVANMQSERVVVVMGQAHLGGAK